MGVATAISGFEQVLKGDPGCGIAAWGIAMSVWGNPFSGLRSAKVIQDGQAAVDRAQTIGAKTTREREYIDAVALLYRNASVNDQRARTMVYEQEMEKIYTKYPDDLEAAEQIRVDWHRQLPWVPLTVVESPYRALVGPLLSYLDVLDDAWPGDREAPITFVVIPEFVARSWWERIRSGVYRGERLGVVA